MVLTDTAYIKFDQNGKIPILLMKQQLLLEGLQLKCPFLMQMQLKSV
jgi:hypothetical protein